MRTILNGFSQFFQYFGRVSERRAEPLPNPWEIPKRSKFYISSQELMMVGLALNHYKQYLNKRRNLKQAAQVDALDHRIYQLINYLQIKEESQKQVKPYA